MTSDESMTIVPDAPASPPAPKINSFSRIGGILFSPVKTLRSIAERPDSMVPLAILFVIFLGVGIVMATHVDFGSAARDAIAARPEIKPEQAERMVRFSSSIGRGVAYSAPVISIAGLAVMAGVLLLAFRLFGGEGDYPRAFSVVVYVSFISAIESVLRTIVVLSRGMVSAQSLQSVLRSNLGFLTDMKEHPQLFALLSSIDLFSFWMLALLITGFAFLSRVARSRSAMIVIGLWLVTVMFKIAMASLQALGKHA